MCKCLCMVRTQGLFKDFQGHIFHFSRTPFSAKKTLSSTTTWTFVPFPLGWINKVSTKIQGLFRTDCNFQRISGP